MEWPRIDASAHYMKTWCFNPSMPHLCGIPDCPGPKLVAKLEAAELLYEALKYEDMRPCPCRHMEARCSRCSALAAWDSASSEAKP